MLINQINIYTHTHHISRIHEFRVVSFRYQGIHHRHVFWAELCSIKLCSNGLHTGRFGPFLTSAVSACSISCLLKFQRASSSHKTQEEKLSPLNPSSDRAEGHGGYEPATTAASLQIRCSVLLPRRSPSNEKVPSCLTSSSLCSSS